MFKRSSSRSFFPRGTAKALFLVAALLLQSFSLPARGVGLAKTAPAKKIASESPFIAQPKLSGAKVFPQPAPVQQQQQPNAPQAAVIVATLSDNVTAVTKVAPGANINYTATITNNGAVVGTDDATNLNYSDTLDANTTLVAGSVHATPIAFNDSYNWVGNTFLDTSARSLPTVIANDVAVNAPAGTDAFTLTAIAGGATSLGGTVTLASPSGAFTYTPPLNRPNLADGASVNDSFTYTITNSADPSLTSTGTVTITLTGRVFYLQAGAAGDGRSGTPSGSPSAMSTAADKSTDVFFIFSNAGSLNGLFTIDAGQQLLGQGVALVINIPVLGSTTLFSAAAPTPATTNGAGNCVTLAGAPGNNTLSGFNIGNCSGVGIAGSNVGTLSVSTLSINTTGQALDLTGVGAPTVSMVLGGLTSSGGARNVNLIGLNGTFTLASGTLSGATGNALHVDGGTAGLTYSGAIQNSGGRQVNIINKTGGTVALSGAISGTGTGIFLNANNGATLNFTGGIALSTGANDAFTATGPGPAATSGGTINVTQNNTSIVNTLTSTTGGGLNITNTTIGGSGVTFRSISANGGSNNGITLSNTGTTAGLTVTGNGGNCTVATPTCTGGIISNKTGADGSITQGSGIFLNSTSGVSLTLMKLNDLQNYGIRGTSVTGFSLTNSIIIGNNGTTAAGGSEEGAVRFDGLFTSATFPTAAITNCVLGGTTASDSSFSDDLRVTNSNGTLNRLTISNTSFGKISTGGTNGLTFSALTTASPMNLTLQDSFFTNAIGSLASITASNSTTMDVVIRRNKFSNNNVNQSSGGGGLVIQGGAGAPAVTYDVSCNTLRDSVGIALLVAKGNGSGAWTGDIINNAVGVTSVALSGSTQASGIKVKATGTNTHTVMIRDNVVRQTNEEGIFIQNNDGSATLNASVFGNTVAEPGGFQFAGVNVDIGALGTDTSICNVVIGSAGTAADKNEVSTGDPSNFSDVNLSRIAGAGTQLNLSKNGSASVTAANVIKDDNLNPATTNTGVSGTVNLVTTLPATPPAVATCTLPPIPHPVDEGARNRMDEIPGSYLSTNAVTQANTQLAKPPVTAPPSVPVSSRVGISSMMAKATTKASAVEVARTYRSEARLSNHAIRRGRNASTQKSNAPTSGENVTLNTIATFPAGGKSITIKYSATVNTPPLARQVQTQGTVTAAGGISVLTDDPEPAGPANPTATLVDTLMTWNGVTSTDWNTITNWTQPAGGTQYAPGVANPAINDVVIPNVGNQPNISATDIGVFSLNIANGRTLTITNSRVLTIGAPAPGVGGDLTLDGIISGGFLNLGTGSHAIINSGGTGSLSSTNVATVLSGSTVTLNNNLQAGVLAVNASGGSMNITNRTLSLNGAGAALTVPGGATFTTTSSTVVFNGTAAQQAAGIAYNNLTINNSLGAHVTGVTLTGNASVAGVLTLTSSDLATGANTLTMPVAATSAPASGASDVVGNVTRTGFVINGAALSFGNPLNTIKINTGTTTAPTSINVLLAKNAPATYQAAVQRSYTITPTGGSGISATLRLHYRQAELNGNVETPTIDFNLRRGPTWSNAVVPTARNTGVVEDNWLENNNVTQFSEWTFAALAPTASNGAITGRIVDGNGQPVEGTVVRLSGTQNRKTITDKEGLYHFNDVETGGLYTVTPSRANYSFNPFNRSFSQVGNQTEAGFNGTMLGDSLNPLDTPEYFVRQQYVDILGREPDEAGFNYWSDQINQCLSVPPAVAGGSSLVADESAVSDCIRSRRTGVASAFFIESEFKQSGAFIYNLYQSSLGRRPVYSEYAADRRDVVGGPTLEAQKQAFAAAFVARAEFASRYESNNTAESFVDALLLNVQASGVDLSSQREGLIGRYNTGASQTESRAFVLRDVTESAAIRDANYNAAFVAIEYFGYLHRTPERGGFDFWLNVLNTGDAGNYRGMVCSFITSTEYQRRFSNVVSHSNNECGNQ